MRLIDADSGIQLKSLGGHTDWVVSVAFSPDGTRGLSGSRDGTVRLWNLETSELIREFRPNLGPIKTAIFSGDASAIFCGGQHSSFLMLDAEDGMPLAHFEGHTEQIMSLALTPSGDIVSGSHDATVRVWRATEWQQQLAAPPSQPVELESSPDDTRSDQAATGDPQRERRAGPAARFGIRVSMPFANSAGKDCIPYGR